MLHKSPSHRNRLPAAALGFLSLGSQIIFIRLLMNIFQGSELTIALALTFWLLGTAIGSLTLPKSFNRSILPLLVIPFLVIEYFYIRFCPLLWGLVVGAQPTLLTMLPILFTSIFPAALVMGLLFPWLANRLINSPADRSKTITQIYLWESLGAFFIAIALNFYLFEHLYSFQILIIACLPFVASIAFRKLPGSAGAERHITGGLVFVCLLLFVTGKSVSRTIHSFTQKNYRLLSEKETPYGNLRICENEGQLVVFNQGQVHYTLPDAYASETRLLLPLLLHPKPRSLMLLGGNPSGLLPFLDSFPTLQLLSYAETNGVLVNLQRDSLQAKQLPDGLQVDLIVADPRRQLAQSGLQFDVICMLEPEPLTLSQNRYFSLEFFREVKQHLSPRGIYFFAVRSSENYVNRNLAEYLNLLKNTLEQIFPSVEIVPGDDNLFIARNDSTAQNLLEQISGSLHRLQINPVYLTPAFLGNRFSAERRNFFRQQLASAASPAINTDFNFSGYRYHFRAWNPLWGRGIQLFINWLEHWKIRLSLIGLAALAALLAIFRERQAQKRIVKLAITGGLSIVLEIVLMLEYQVLHGTLYAGVALIFGIYMVGLASGTSIIQRGNHAGREENRFRWIVAGFGGCTALLLLLPAGAAGSFSGKPMLLYLLQWLFMPALILCIGFLTGAYFSLTTTSLYNSRLLIHSGTTYGAELTGAVVGALLTTAILIPLLGISGILILVFILLLILLFS